jgi:hypothetical protein
MVTNVSGPRYLCVDGLTNNRHIISMADTSSRNVYYAIFDENLNYTLPF